MKSRLSKPTLEEVAEKYGYDAMSLIADQSYVSIGDVIAMYMSKVGTWRQTPSWIDESNALETGDTLTTKAQWWTFAIDKIEGAPEWLYDEFVGYWASWWEEREDQGYLGYSDTSLLIGGQYVYEDPPSLP